MTTPGVDMTPKPMISAMSVSFSNETSTTHSELRKTLINEKSTAGLPEDWIEVLEEQVSDRGADDWPADWHEQVHLVSGYDRKSRTAGEGRYTAGPEVPGTAYSIDRRTARTASYWSGIRAWAARRPRSTWGSSRLAGLRW